MKINFEYFFLKFMNLGLGLHLLPQSFGRLKRKLYRVTSTIRKRQILKISVVVQQENVVRNSAILSHPLLS